MLLNNCELIPGVVQSTTDPKNLGRIKCVVPGYIDNATMSEENMPWVYPLTMSGYQSFTKPIAGQKVWVLINKSNYNEYWYIHFHEQNDITREYLDDKYNCTNSDVLVSRDTYGTKITDTYDDNNGFSRKIGDDHMNMYQDNHIELLAGNGQVDINHDIVKCGSTDGGDYTETIRYDKLIEMLTELQSGFSMLLSSSATYSLTPLQEGFKKCMESLDMMNKLKAEHCKVN